MAGQLRQRTASVWILAGDVFKVWLQNQYNQYKTDDMFLLLEGSLFMISLQEDIWDKNQNPSVSSIDCIYPVNITTRNVREHIHAQLFFGCLYERVVYYGGQPKILFLLGCTVCPLHTSWKSLDMSDAVWMPLLHSVQFWICSELQLVGQLSKRAASSRIEGKECLFVTKFTVYHRDDRMAVMRSLASVVKLPPHLMMLLRSGSYAQH